MRGRKWKVRKIAISCVEKRNPFAVVNIISVNI